MITFRDKSAGVKLLQKCFFETVQLIFRFSWLQENH